MLDDNELAKRAARGDLDAFGSLFNRYTRDVYRLALSMGHRRGEAEDLMQDTFLAALEGIGRFEGRSSFKTWLTSILLRQAGRQRRYQAIRVTETLNEAATGQRESATPQQHASRLDVEAMLASLSPDHREVLVLRELQGLSYDEIAVLLEIPRGTVESRLFRARNLLRDRFKEYQSLRPPTQKVAAVETLEMRHE